MRKTSRCPALLGVLTLLVLATAAASAGAATNVSEMADGSLLIQDTVGATDIIGVAREQSTWVVAVPHGLVSRSQPLQAGSGCTLDQLGPGGEPRVLCPTSATSPTPLMANLGAGDDRLAVGRDAGAPSVDATIHGEGGNDLLVGCNGNDVIDGGDGDDTISSDGQGTTESPPQGASAACFSSTQLLSPPPAPTHQLMGGAGDDTIKDSRFSIDIVDGGAGEDTYVSGPFGIGGSSRCSTVFWTITLDNVANDSGKMPGAASGCTEIPAEPADNVRSTVENVDADGRTTGASAPNHLRGGDFDDILIGGSPTIALPPSKTGVTDDVLEGRGGDDRISGEGGNDLVSGGDGNDTLNGGAGPDSVQGGNGNDTMTASDGADTFSGGAGNDTMEGGTSVDHFSGGSGADSIDARDGNAELVACGTEVDSVDVDLRDNVLDDCENVDRGAVKEGPNVRIATGTLTLGRGGRVRVRLTCPAKLSLPCRGRLSLGLFSGKRRASPSEGTRYSIAHGASKRVTVVLSARDRRALRSRHKAQGQLTAIERGVHGRKTTVRVVALRR
jgi:RTX calcium-binding nonapeptide repeat (4 copies)